ncbi:MAG: hypothetical protein Q9N34_05345 [Aquificota bacterium]|nr:hypothetical protein [Aquificota bacterium]
MEETIKEYGLLVFNASDGAKIEGAEPVEPERITLPEVLHKTALIRTMGSNFRDTYLREFKLKDSLREFINDVSRITQKVSANYTKAPTGPTRLHDKAHQLHPRLEGGSSGCP